MRRAKERVHPDRLAVRLRTQSVTAEQKLVPVFSHGGIGTSATLRSPPPVFIDTEIRATLASF
jgi:hypothetical protein